MNSLYKSFSKLSPNSKSSTKPSRNQSTSPKRNIVKDQIIQQITSLMTLELNKIDTKEIETKLSIYFNISENDSVNTYIKSLCNNISETKNSTIEKVKKFLNSNLNSILVSNTSSLNNNINPSSNEADNQLIFKSILKEVKTLNNNSRVKFKKLYDSLANDYDKFLCQLSEYIQKNNSNLAIDRLSKIEQIKNDILFDVTSVENIQNKFTDTIKTIINKNNKVSKLRGRFRKLEKLDNSRFSQKSNSYYKNKTNTSVDRVNRSCFGYSANNIYKLNNNNDQHECIKLYRIKIKEKKSEIEKLKQQLQQEKESKNKAINDFNKLQYANKMLLSMNNSQKNSTNLEKFNKLTEMIINFTYSMNNLRNSLFQKTISHTDAKNIYSKLKMKLIALIEETYTLKKTITADENNENNKNNEENKNSENNMKYNDMDTIKEENENSQMFSERELSNRYKNGDNLNIVLDSNRHNNNKSILIENLSSGRSNNSGNIVNNNITLNTVPNSNLETLIQENKKLRSQLAEKNANNENNNISNLSNNSDSDIYKNQVNELKKVILDYENEIDNLKNNSINHQKEELNNIIQNNTKNLEQLKTIYQLLIDNKDNRIKELEEEIISHEKEIENLKEEIKNLKNESRKEKIILEAEVNNLKNEKMELQCLLENGGNNSNRKNSTLQEKDGETEKIDKLESEIKVKNEQIILLTKNHENDLKELNLAIEMLKQKIAELEEENALQSARSKNVNE